MVLMVGSDPEVFIQDKYFDYVSAHGILPGTKKTPFKVERGAVQVDGNAFEYNIDAVSTEEEWEKNHKAVQAQMLEMVQKVCPDFRIVFHPYARFQGKYFLDLPAEAKVLGCDPDYDENGAENTLPEGIENKPFRTAAGHVHIGWTEGKSKESIPHKMKCQEVARVFKNEDMFVPKTLLEQKRTYLYGKPGAHRPKSYGVELRSPSNLWVAKEETRRKMFRLVNQKFHENFK